LAAIAAVIATLSSQEERPSCSTGGIDRAAQVAPHRIDQAAAFTRPSSPVDRVMAPVIDAAASLARNAASAAT